MPERNHHLLIAATPPRDVPADRRVVAVSAAAVQALVHLGVTPTVVDDLVDREAALGSDGAYIRWQLEWFSRLDAAAGADGAVVVSAQKLKPAVDSLVIAGRLAAALLDEVRPDTVEVLTMHGVANADPLHDGHLQFWPKLGDAPLWGEIIPIVGAARGVPVTTTYDEPVETDAAAPPALVTRLKSSLAARTGPVRHFDLARWRPGARSGTTLLLWGGGYGARSIVTAERAAGRRVVTLERGGSTTRLFEPTPWGRRTLTAPIPVAARPAAAGGTALSTALSEIDDVVGVPGLSAVLRSRLDAFVHRIVPAVGAAAAGLTPELERLGVDSVVVANPSSIEEFAALLAAGRLGIDRTLAQHGDHMFSYDGWFVSEFGGVDCLLASDATLLDDLPDAARRLGARPVAVRTSKHREGASTTTSAAPSGPVCYVPGVLMGDTALRPSMYFDDAWYHRWHLDLLAWMGRHPGVRFIWKGLPSGDHVVDPIIAAVNATPNVEYVSEPFPWILGKVSRMFTDFPSTPAYEARSAGVATLVLTFPRFAELRPRALAEFGDGVQVCRDETAALAVLSSWLVS